MTAIYLYPITARNFTGITNPYLSFLTEALSRNFEVVNKDHPSVNGIFDLIKYLRRIDMVYFNWIEDLPEKKGGLIQTILFIPLFFLLKISKIKILWTLHNKESHSKNHPIIKRILFQLMMKQSDLVLTHARDGLDMIPSKTAKFFLPHPVNLRSNRPEEQLHKKYDIIIWGSIARYKGIDSFLEYLIKNELIKDYRILIAGKIVESDLEKYLSSLHESYNNISLINKFLEQDELDSLISQSKIILFTYHSDSILSSGALMDSLIHKSMIIGPKTGAFKDLASEGMIFVYDDMTTLIDLLNSILAGNEDENPMLTRLENFIQHNTWEEFAGKIEHVINSILLSN